MKGLTEWAQPGTPAHNVQPGKNGKSNNRAVCGYRLAPGTLKQEYRNRRTCKRCTSIGTKNKSTKKGTKTNEVS